MQEMYRRGQPYSEILSARFSDMRQCYKWSENIAQTEANITAEINKRLNGIT